MTYEGQVLQEREILSAVSDGIKAYRVIQKTGFFDLNKEIFVSAMKQSSWKDYLRDEQIGRLFEIVVKTRKDKNTLSFTDYLLTFTWLGKTEQTTEEYILADAGKVIDLWHYCLSVDRVNTDILTSRI